MNKRTILLLALIFAGCARSQAQAQAENKVESPNPTEPIVASPTLVSEPSDADFVKNYPVKGWNDHVEGQALLSCDLSISGALSGCSIAEETPPGEGFGEAALKLAPQYRLTPKIVDGQPVHTKLRFRIRFVAPKLPGEPLSSETPVDRPWWMCPDPNAPPDRFYPKDAQERNVWGLADIECRFSTTGRIVACAWISENPPRYGFGEKAERMGCGLKMKVMIPEGAASELRIFKTTVRFALKH